MNNPLFSEVFGCIKNGVFRNLIVNVLAVLVTCGHYIINRLSFTIDVIDVVVMFATMLLSNETLS